MECVSLPNGAQRTMCVASVRTAASMVCRPAGGQPLQVRSGANAWLAGWLAGCYPQSGRQPLPEVDEVTYLGMEVQCAARSFRACAGHRLGRMKEAQAAIRGRLKDLHTPHDPNIATGLFASITAAAGSCGCEIWAISFLHAWHLKADGCALHAHHATVYKRCLGLPLLAPGRVLAAC